MSIIYSASHNAPRTVSCVLTPLNPVYVNVAKWLVS